MLGMSGFHPTNEASSSATDLNGQTAHFANIIQSNQPNSVYSAQIARQLVPANERQG